MTSTLAEAPRPTSLAEQLGVVMVMFGNANPQEVIYDPETMEQRRRDLPGPLVTTTMIPCYRAGRLVGIDRLPGETEEDFLARDAADIEAQLGDPLHTFPDVHDDSLLGEDMHRALRAVTDPAARPHVRRMLLRAHLAERVDGVTHLPDHSAFVAVAHPTQGAWANVSAHGARPAWVWSNHEPFGRFLAEHYDCPFGIPDDVEDTHYTQYGKTVYPPGAAPDPLSGISMLHLNSGRDQQSTQQFGWGYLGTNGVATATSSTSLTGAAETGTSHASNDSDFQTVYAGPNTSGAGSTAYGLITANTSGATPVYTVDRWYAAATPGGSAATTPNTTATYSVPSGGQPSQFIGLSTSTAAVNATDTTLPSEITTSGGGLIRKLQVFTHSAGAATVVQTSTATANGSDSLPVTIGKAGLSQSLLSTVTNAYQTLVSPTATLSSIGDQLTTTWTFTMT